MVRKVWLSRRCTYISTPMLDECTTCRTHVVVVPLSRRAVSVRIIVDLSAITD